MNLLRGVRVYILSGIRHFENSNFEMEHCQFQMMSNAIFSNMTHSFHVK